jgi:DNA-binding IclR family transcriptional regulator
MIEVRGTQALQRGLALLREIAVSDVSGITLSELVRRAGLTRSTTHRLLECLVLEELAIKGDGKRYHLGRRAYDLGLLATHRYEMRGVSLAPLRQLAQDLGETVFLTRRFGLDVICLERVEGRNARADLTMAVGIRRPIGIGAGGLALLAALDPREADAIIATNRARLEAYYGDSLAARLAHRVRIARRRGYAVADGIRSPETRGIGIAVSPPDEAPILSLSLVCARKGLTEARMAEILAALRATAAAIVAG